MEPRRRNLIILGSAAAISLVLAALALEQRIEQGAPKYKPTEFLPGFAANVKNAALIHIVSHSGAFDVTYTPDKGWVLPAKGGYPADFDEVRHELIGLAALETIAPKTDHAEWLHYLSLDTPPKGTGTEITVKDAQGKVLASLIAGNTEELGDPNGSNGLFVRHPDENQAWLARAVFTPHGDPSAWLNTHVVTVGATRLQEAVMMPASGPAFTLSRAKPSDQIYALANAPKNSQPNSLTINKIAYTIANFSFSDVAPAASIDFSKPGHAVARTFEGLLVNFDIAQTGGDVWVRLSASTAPGAGPSVAQEAAAINARAGGWAYKMPPEKGTALLTTLAQVMTPPPPPPGGMPFSMPAGMGGATP